MAFRLERPFKGFICPGLALSYQPREHLAIGRVDRLPDADDIELVVSLAREAFIFITSAPKREVIELNGVVWNIARWSLKRESVAEHLPRKRRNR